MEPRERHNPKDPTVVRSIEELASSKIPALKKRYRELFGEESKSSNKQFLFRRIAFRLQANAEGDLSERARRRIGDIADDRDIRVRAPKEFVARPEPGFGSVDRKGPPKDCRLPGPGTVLTRRLGDRQIVVKVLAEGFEYESRRYRSLSAIAREPIFIAKTGAEIAAEGLARIEREPSTRESGHKQKKRDCSLANHQDLWPPIPASQPAGGRPPVYHRPLAKRTVFDLH
jgi:hypothetical protein